MQQQCLTGALLTPWILVEDGCGATRGLANPAEGAPTDVFNRVAFIEKTPRVRDGAIPRAEGFNLGDDSKNWRAVGGKGCGPGDEESRAQCDTQLRAKGYVLPEDGI